MAEIINSEKTLKITENVAQDSDDEIVEKPKRKMTDKQKEALARGRKIAQEKRRKDKDDLETLKLDKKLDELKDSVKEKDIKNEKKQGKKKKNSRPKKTKPPTPPSSESEYSEEESESSSSSDDDEPPPRKMIVEKPKKKKVKPKNVIVEQRLPPKPLVHFL
tara:strand:- start:930 stop:1415 length:486 start_codon:yes stop_codon:yes gene_type:complete